MPNIRHASLISLRARHKHSLLQTEKKFQTALNQGAMERVTKVLPNFLGAIDKAAKSGVISTASASRKKTLVSYAVVKILKQVALPKSNDRLAITVANILAVANAQAKSEGWDVADSVVTIRQYADHGGRWRVNYGAKNPVQTRGGDLLVELDAKRVRVTKVLFGQ